MEETQSRKNTSQSYGMIDDAFWFVGVVRLIGPIGPIGSVHHFGGRTRNPIPQPQTLHFSRFSKRRFGVWPLLIESRRDKLFVT